MPERDTVTAANAEVLAIPVRSLSFLVVDDDADQRFLLAASLAKMGMTKVAEAGSGREALEKLGRDGGGYDILISDLQMPEIDGMELVRQIGQRRLPVSVILVTALAGDVLQSAAMMTEAYGVAILGTLEKPATKDKLFPLLARRQARAAARAPRAAPGYVPTTDEVLHGFAGAQFEPFFQPVLELATGRIAGAEALARWRHPIHGVLGPEVFLPPLVRAGLLDELSWIMLALSAMEARRWQVAGFDMTVSVNVSAMSLADPGYAESVTEIVTAHGLEPSRMILELTETEAILNAGAALENVTRLRIKGFGLAVDDYGVGYSSMQELSRMPFTEIKVDRTFVKAAVADSRPRLMIEQIVSIARKLGLKIVAEGVETRAEREMLAGIGCDMIQGHFVAKALEGTEFLSWMREFRADAASAAAAAPSTATTASDSKRFGT